MLVVVLLILLLAVDEFNPYIAYSRCKEFVYDSKLSDIADACVKVTFRIQPDDCQI